MSPRSPNTHKHMKHNDLGAPAPSGQAQRQNGGPLKSSEVLWIHSMGKRFQVLAMFPDSPEGTDAANAYCAKHDEAAVIATNGGQIFIASKYAGENGKADARDAARYRALRDSQGLGLLTGRDTTPERWDAHCDALLRDREAANRAPDNGPWFRNQSDDDL